MEYSQIALGLSRLADPHRLKILGLLEAGQRSAGELLTELDISQPTLSHHMKILCQGSLVQPQRQGQRILYSLDRGALRQLLDQVLPAEPPPAPTQEEATPGVIVYSGHNWER